MFGICGANLDSAYLQPLMCALGQVDPANAKIAYNPKCSRKATVRATANHCGDRLVVQERSSANKELRNKLMKLMPTCRPKPKPIEREPK